MNTDRSSADPDRKESQERHRWGRVRRTNDLLAGNKAPSNSQVPSGSLNHKNSCLRRQYSMTAENKGIGVAWCWAQTLALSQSLHLLALGSVTYSPGMFPYLIELPKIWVK